MHLIIINAFFNKLIKICYVKISYKFQAICAHYNY